jgi:hypothetical protein
VERAEFEGQRRWPVDSNHGFPGCGSGAAWVGHAPGDDAQRFDEFQPREVRTNAVVLAAAEGEYRRGTCVGDVEAVGFVENARIPGTNRYRFTADGLRFAIFYTKLHDRLLGTCSPQTGHQRHRSYETRCSTIDIHITQTIEQARLILKSA